MDFICWKLMLQEKVRLLVELRGGEDGWSLGVEAEAWPGLEVGVRFSLIDFKLLVQGMKGVTEKVGLNSVWGYIVGGGESAMVDIL